jgi:hypothetical protein
MFRVIAFTLALASTARADPKRDLPDYDGRGNADAQPSDALWVPRVLLAPLYAVHELLVRRPIGELVTTAERDHWKEHIENVLYIGPDHRILWFPTFLYDFGGLPSVGLSLHARHAFADANAIHLHVGTWGPDWLWAYAEDRYAWRDQRLAVATRVEFRRRADNLFVGVGPDVTSATRARYGLQRVDANESMERGFDNESKLAVAVGVRSSMLRTGACCGDPALSDRIAAGEVMPPPGYDPSHVTIYERAALRLDSRRPRPAPGTGAYLELHGENQLDVNTADRWLRYGGETGVAIDLRGRQRNLKLVVASELVDPIGARSDVPFYELAQLGGDDTMSGFLPGWMNGRSAIAGGVAYTWPVWTWLDGQLRMSTGNAFGEHLSGFAARKLRLSADVGVTTIGARDAAVQLLVGAGTETFEQGTRITSLRVVLGSKRGF